MFFQTQTLKAMKREDFFLRRPRERITSRVCVLDAVALFYDVVTNDVSNKTSEWDRDVVANTHTGHLGRHLSNFRVNPTKGVVHKWRRKFRQFLTPFPVRHAFYDIRPYNPKVIPAAFVPDKFIFTDLKFHVSHSFLCFVYPFFIPGLVCLPLTIF